MMALSPAAGGISVGPAQPLRKTRLKQKILLKSAGFAVTIRLPI
jgi:hypothetical protein